MKDIHQPLSLPPFTTVYSISTPQNKCVKYWPEEDEGVKELQAPKGTIIVKFLCENEMADYMLREFEVSKVGEVRE